MKTFQDFSKVGDKIEFIRAAIEEYRAGEVYQVAVIADEYDRQRNTTICQYTKYLYSADGRQIVDQYSSNNRIASNFFRRLNNQRCTYSLGNGVSFSDHTEKRRNADGDEITVDTTKEALGYRFDNALYKAGYYALIHGISFGFWNKDRLHVFKATEFCPLWDEYDGTLKAGIRFWSLDWQKKPVTAVLYELDGYTVYRTKDGSTGLDLAEIEPKRAYILNTVRSEADGEMIVGESNYSSLPIVPLWGSSRKQSTLVGMREAIDSYDLIQSGFANDLQDCAQIYWLIGGNFGMDNAQTAQFLDRLKLQHVANVDTENSSITPYTQEIPTQARETYLEVIRKQLYEDFGALDVTNISAGAKTATEIESAYEPMDEEADDFEYQLIEFIQQILTLIGIEDTPVFKRNRVTNQYEQTQMVMLAADKLDDRTLLSLLPFISIDQVDKILANRDADSDSRFEEEETEEEAAEETEE